MAKTAEFSPQTSDGARDTPVEPTYSIGELRNIFSLSARALRHYEERGLIAPLRDGLKRVYTMRDFRRLEVIVKGRRADLGLAEIDELLRLYTAEDGGHAQLLKARERLAVQAALIEAKRAEVVGLLHGIILELRKRS
jgi:DNA-binding transcriptional MerR regulator